MYGIPDPHALLRPWKDIKELTEELFAMLRPVSPPPLDENDEPERPRYESNVNDLPGQPDLISPSYDSSDDVSFGRGGLFGGGSRTLVPRRPPRSYDTDRRQGSQANYADWQRKSYGQPTEEARRPVAQPQPDYVRTSLAQAQAQEPARSYAPPPESPGFSIPSGADHSLPGLPQIPDVFGIGHDLDGMRQGFRVSSSPYVHPLAGNFFGGGDFFSPPQVYTGVFQPGGPFQQSPLYSANSVYSPAAGHYGTFVGSPNFYSSELPTKSAGEFYSGAFVPGAPQQYPTYVAGSDCGVVAPAGGPWEFAGPLGPFYIPPIGPAGDSVLFVPVVKKDWFIPPGPTEADWPMHFLPGGAGGAGGIAGKVVSGSGSDYQVILYSNGPDQPPDNGGAPQPVKIVSIDEQDTIPPDTWLFGILQLKDANGNPANYAQPPVWAG